MYLSTYIQELYIYVWMDIYVNVNRVKKVSISSYFTECLFQECMLNIGEGLSNEDNL